MNPQSPNKDYNHLGLYLQINMMPISELNPYTKNARTHSNKQIKQIANSIKEFGFINPILIDKNNQIIAGHGRLEGAKRLGLKEVPTIRLEHLNENQKRAYIIADNRLAELASWDKSILIEEINFLILFRLCYILNQLKESLRL